MNLAPCTLTSSWGWAQRRAEALPEGGSGVCPEGNGPQHEGVGRAGQRGRYGRRKGVERGRVCVLVLWHLCSLCAMNLQR